MSAEQTPEQPKNLQTTKTGYSMAQRFAIIGVSRADLMEHNFSEEEVAQLDDGDMERIADRLTDHYVEMGFGDDLEYVARRALGYKGKHGMGAQNKADTA